MTKFVGHLKSHKAFTLIEMVVVIGITGIITVLISEIFVNIVQGNVNATVTNDVRSQGEVLIETVARSIRSADQLLVAGSAPTLVTQTNSITLSVGGNTTTYDFSCNNFLQNGSQLNAAYIQIDTSPSHCLPTGFSDVGQYSYFIVTPGTSQSPAQVKIVITLFTRSGPGFHSEYATRQTLTQSAVSLGQYKK
jgi:prepilin-type N-terminal cleavage/methylation domain-containing protein